MTIGAVSFGNEPQQKKSSSLPVVTTLAGGAIGAFGIREKITSKDVLKKDTFELGSKAVAEDKAIAAEISEILPQLKDDKLAAKADTLLGQAFAGKETLTAEEYLGKSMTEFEKDITTAETELKGLEDAAKAKTTAFNNADEAGKAAAKLEKEAAEEAFSTNKKLVDAFKEEVKFVKEAKDGIITKDAFKSHITEKVKTAGKNEIDDLLKTLKSVPKKASVKMGLIAAGVGLVLGVLFSGGKKAAPTEEAKA